MSRQVPSVFQNFVKMGRFFLHIVFLSISLGIAAQGDMEALMKSEMHAAEQKMNFRSSVFTENYDLRYHRLEWSIDPAIQAISGVVTSYFIPTGDDLPEIYFDLKENMVVDSVIRNGSHLGHLHEGDLLQVSFGELLPAETLDSVSIFYHGEPITDGLGTFYAGDHNGTPELWTLSEPYGAMSWWPCKQDLNDKIDSIDIMVTCPTGNRVASNGLLINEIDMGAQVLFHWKHRYPVPAYLIAIAVTNYEQYSDFVTLESGQDLEVLNYVYPESYDDWQAASGDIVDIMTFFNQTFEDYPYPDEKYGHAQFGRGGGMEHTTMSFMGGMYFNLMAHELAHQWFGDKITCGSWEDIWLNEGFATYLQVLCEEEFHPDVWEAWKSSAISDVCSEVGGSVKVDDLSSVNRVFSGRLSYRKGALLLHMLRWELGNEDFFQSIRNYLADPELAYGYATTADLIRHLEETADTDLTEFFSDWYSGEGYPSHIVQYAQVGSSIEVQIDQSQSHPSVDFFQLSAPIKFIGSDADSILVFPLAYSGQVFEAELDFEVEYAVFDPERWIISKSNIVVAGLDALTEENGINAFPNPASSEITVTLKRAVPAGTEAQVYDSTGKLVLKQSLERGKRFGMNVANLAAGTYTLRILSEETEMELRFGKE